MSSSTRSTISTASAVPSPLSKRGDKSVLRFEAQPTRMFGSYSVTAHYIDGSTEALAYGTPHYCIAEAARRNAALPAAAPATRRTPDQRD
jgi:hypothetical protein